MHAGYQCLYFCAAELAVIQYPCRIGQLRLQHPRPLYFRTVEFAVVQYPCTIAQLNLLFDIFVTFELPYNWVSL